MKSVLHQLIVYYSVLSHQKALHSIYLGRVQLPQRGPLWPAGALESSMNKDSSDAATLWLYSRDPNNALMLLCRNAQWRQ